MLLKAHISGHKDLLYLRLYSNRKMVCAPVYCVRHWN